ncbi:MAG: MraY family glycosyltransferase [Pseudomonadota bacterium]
MKNKNRDYVPRPFYIAGLVLSLILICPATQRYFSNLGERWLYVAGLSFALSFCLTPVCKSLAIRRNIMLRTDTTGIPQNPTPVLGGVAVFLAFLISILLNGIYSGHLFAILVGSAIVFGAGLLSDLREVSAWVRLVFQVVSALLVMAFGVSLKIFPSAMGLSGQVLNQVVTILWIVGLTNAISFFNGMDGLTGGLGAIFSLFLGIVSLQTDQPFLGWTSIALMGACVGFLPYNFRYKKRASIFMGHAGSMVTGFILACLAVYGDWSPDRPIVALASPLLIFWIPIFDMVYTTGRRVIEGKVSGFKEWIQYVGKDHLHHRLAYVLGEPKKGVVLIHLVSMCLGISAVVLRYARTIDSILLIIQAFMIVLVLTILETYGRARLSRGNS